MELTDYVRILRKWLWLILLGAFVGGGVGIIFSSRQVPVYSASATVSIGAFQQNPNPTTTEINIALDLVQTYQQLVFTHDVLQGVVDALDLNVPAEALRGIVYSSVIPDTSLITITVRFTDPILAADIANTMVDQLIIHSPTNLTPAQQAQIDFDNQQIQALTDQITQQRALINELDQQISATSDRAEITSLNQQKSVLVDQINQASATIAQFTTNVTTLQQRTNAVTVVDRAIIPEVASNSSSTMAVLFGAAVGAALAGWVGFIVDYIDDKIRTPEKAATLLSVPVLGAIPKFGKKNASYKERLISQFPSVSLETEAYRRLRTNIVFMSSETNQKLFVVSSSGPGEGKSVTTANLAVTMAAAGTRVLLIDADMRRPTQHQIFGLENNVGLSTLLFVDPNGRGEDDRQGLRNLDQCLQSTDVPNLKVITSGFVPSNPSEILGSVLMKRWIEAFRGSSNIDVILIDTPPILMFADTSTVAALADADVMLIVDCERTPRSAAIKAREQLKQVGANVKGVILNRMNIRDDSNYYYGYGYNYYYSTPETNKGGLRGLLRRRQQ